MIHSLTKIYEGANLNGATSGVVYLPILKAGTLKRLDVKTDEAVAVANAVFSLSLNGVVIAGLSPTIATGAKIGAVENLNVALARGDELVLNLVSGAVSSPIAFNVDVDDGAASGDSSLPAGDLNATTNVLEKVRGKLLDTRAPVNNQAYVFDSATNKFIPLSVMRTGDVSGDPLTSYMGRTVVPVQAPGEYSGSLDNTDQAPIKRTASNAGSVNIADFYSIFASGVITIEDMTAGTFDSYGTLIRAADNTTIITDDDTAGGGRFRFTVDLGATPQFFILEFEPYFSARGAYTLKFTGAGIVNHAASGAVIGATAAGGDLSGTYPNPKVGRFTGKVVPSSSNSVGAIGDFAFDANYIYLCVAVNTWKRIPLAAF